MVTRIGFEKHAIFYRASFLSFLISFSPDAIAQPANQNIPLAKITGQSQGYDDASEKKYDLFFYSNPISIDVNVVIKKPGKSESFQRLRCDTPCAINVPRKYGVEYSVRQSYGDYTVTSSLPPIGWIEHFSTKLSVNAININLSKKLELSKEELKAIKGKSILVILPTPEIVMQFYLPNMKSVAGTSFKMSSQLKYAQSIVENSKLWESHFENVALLRDITFVDSNLFQQSMNNSYDYTVTFVPEKRNNRVTIEDIASQKTIFVMRNNKSGTESEIFDWHGNALDVFYNPAVSGFYGVIGFLRGVAKHVGGESGQNIVMSPKPIPLSSSINLNTSPNTISNSNQAQSQLRENTDSQKDAILDRAILRCNIIGFKRSTAEFRKCITDQIEILSK
jgi:hypothetical protein